MGCDEKQPRGPTLSYDRSRKTINQHDRSHKTINQHAAPAVQRSHCPLSKTFASSFPSSPKQGLVGPFPGCCCTVLMEQHILQPLGPAGPFGSIWCGVAVAPRRDGECSASCSCAHVFVCACTQAPPPLTDFVRPLEQHNGCVPHQPLAASQPSLTLCTTMSDSGSLMRCASTSAHSSS